jgi:hypothetical protein
VVSQFEFHLSHVTGPQGWGIGLGRGGIHGLALFAALGQLE